MNTYINIYNQVHWKSSFETNKRLYRESHPGCKQTTFRSKSRLVRCEYITNNFEWKNTKEGMNYWLEIHCLWISLFRDKILYEDF